MEASFDASTWMQLIGLGAMMGALGQGVRAIVGLKKVNDAVSMTTASASDIIEPSRLVTSLVIGGIAGSLAAVSLIDNLAVVTSAQIFALLGAGYSGADFIEGFMSRVTPSTSASGQESIGVGSAAPAGSATAPLATGGGSSDDAVG